MEVVRRRACRALLLTPANETLLIKIENPDGSWSGWITPGGGIDRGEDEISALRRELHEELGLKKFEVGPKIWKRFHKFPWREKLIEQEEVYFLVRIDRFEVHSTANPDALEMMDLKEFRWWTRQELMISSEQFAPGNLPALLNEIVVSGNPRSVRDVGV
jgi:8-oxo-dGTP pyrophosphatase MutT (NUDIX family)